MLLRVKDLIETLHYYPADAEIVLESLGDDQEFYITSFNSGDGILTIVITEEKEQKEEEQKEEEQKEYG